MFGATALGIIIGVAVVTSWRSAARSCRCSDRQHGANNVTIQSGARFRGVTFGGSVPSLTLEDADDRRMPDVKVVARRPRALQVVRKSQLGAGLHLWYDARLSTRDLVGMAEEMFTEQDVRNQTKICVVGQSIVRRAVPR
jgi:hypothetical protein